MSEARYYAKRAAGVSPIRRDGSVTAAETDRQAGAAEEFAAKRLGAEFNAEVYASNGDGGADFYVGGRSVEVIWGGTVRDTSRPRLAGHLIVNPDEPQRHADLYVVVLGTIEAGFTIAGWASHAEVTAGALKDFGYGLKYAVRFTDLNWFRDGVLAA